MIAHLQNGEYNGNRILHAETAEMMHNSPLTLLPPLNRMELGFFETNINGREVIGHLGDTQYFHTSLHLFLKENVGFYVSFNSPGKAGAAGSLRGALFEDFADRYFPRECRRPRSTPRSRPSTPRCSRAIGRIRAARSRTSSRSWVSSGRPRSASMPRASWSLPFLGLNGKPRHWVEIAPFVWRDTGSHDRLAAKVVDGKAVRFSFDELSPVHGVRARALVSGRRVAAADALRRSRRAGADGVLWPIAAIVRRRYGATLALDAEVAARLPLEQDRARF